MFIWILFILSTLLIVTTGIGAVVTKNIMHACIYLLGSLLGISGLYITLGADFVAVTQIMVYVGGVVILMLFAVMLTGGKDFVSKAQNLLGLVPLMGNNWSYAFGFLGALVFSAISVYFLIELTETITPVQEQLQFESTVESLGKLLITDHVLAFELSSVLLLGALVGAAIIARPRRND
jgi:NADH-quinone oxidoreductase subunit J